MMNDVAFFAFAALIISAAVSVVTLTDLRKAALAFVALGLALSALFATDGPLLLALGQLALALVVAPMCLRSQRADSDERRPILAMVTSPNSAIALFILLCFTAVITPSWMYSIWKPQPGEAPERLGNALLNLGGQYLLVVGAVALLLIIALIIFPGHRNQSSTTAPDSIPGGDSN